MSISSDGDDALGRENVILEERGLVEKRVCESNYEVQYKTREIEWLVQCWCVSIQSHIYAMKA